MFMKCIEEFYNSKIIGQLKGLNTLSGFSVIFTRKTTVAISCLLSYIPSLLKKVLTLKSTEFATKCKPLFKREASNVKKVVFFACILIFLGKDYLTNFLNLF